MDFLEFLNLADLTGVEIREVEDLLENGDIEFVLSKGELAIDYSEFLSGDRYNFWNHLILLLSSFPLETDPKDLLSRFN